MTEEVTYDEVVRVARSVATHKGYPFTLQRYADVLRDGRTALRDRQAPAHLLTLFDRIVEGAPLHGGGFGA